MSAPTFFFYDLETSGLSSSDDRIMQFAGQRTNLNLEEIGEPVNLLVKLANDTLPSPSAILTTKITPQSTQQDGISEPELSKFLSEQVFTPETIILGFNSVRFDDKFIQHLFWRNFYDPYEWQWKDGRSRWDMLDVVRMTRALRPEGINWPVTEEGKPTNRLELITKLNGISHESAHDALSDVTALIDVTRLIKKTQPNLFNYLFKLRDKREVKNLIDPKNPVPFVYSSGRYGSEFNFTTVAVPLFLTKNGNCIVSDLRYNLDELLEAIKTEHPDFLNNPKLKLSNLLFPKFKELAFNRCPAVAPLSVLDKNNGWEKISLDKETIKNNLKILDTHSELIKKLKNEENSREGIQAGVDPESSLYSSFLPDSDRPRLSAGRNADENDLADFHPVFADPRLPELLLHYKAKNFPTSLSESETKKWEEYRQARLNRQAPAFLSELEKFKKSGADDFILEELFLWYESLKESDY